MQKIVSVKCPRCNNSLDFHLYGFDKEGYQKYKCLKCNRQFAPDNPKTKKKKITLVVLSAEKLLSYTTIILCTQTTAAVIKSVTTPCLNLKVLTYHLLLSLNL